MSGPLSLGLAPASLQALADDTASVDAIIDAYYEVISGPAGFVYDAERDENIHAPDALIKSSSWMARCSSDFKTEQASIVTPYETPFSSLKSRKSSILRISPTYGASLR